MKLDLVPKMTCQSDVRMGATSSTRHSSHSHLAPIRGSDNTAECPPPPHTLYGESGSSTRSAYYYRGHTTPQSKAGERTRIIQPIPVLCVFSCFRTLKTKHNSKMLSWKRAHWLNKWMCRTGRMVFQELPLPLLPTTQDYWNRNRWTTVALRKGSWSGTPQCCQKKSRFSG